VKTFILALILFFSIPNKGHTVDGDGENRLAAQYEKLRKDVDTESPEVDLFLYNNNRNLEDFETLPENEDLEDSDSN
jgi:uncharacterized protein YwgA